MSRLLLRALLVGATLSAARGARAQDSGVVAQPAGKCDSFESCAALVKRADHTVAAKEAEVHVKEESLERATMAMPVTAMVALDTLSPSATTASNAAVLAGIELARQALQQAKAELATSQVAANSAFAEANAQQKCGTGEVFNPDAPASSPCVNIASALSSGLLMQYGFTAGISVALHTPIVFHGTGASNTYVTGYGVTPLGYLAVFPFYWGDSEKVRLLCARVKPTDSTQKTQAVAEGIRKLHAHEKKDPNAKPGCGWNTVGLFAGIPASFQADSVLNNAYSAMNPGSRTIRPLFSAGFITDPIAPWLHFLLGVTYSDVQADTIPGAPTATGSPKVTPPDLKVVTWLFGIGGSFDIASLVIGAK